MRKFDSEEDASSFLLSFENNVEKANNFLSKFNDNGKIQVNIWGKLQMSMKKRDFLQSFNNGNEANNWMKKFSDINEANEFLNKFNENANKSSKSIYMVTILTSAQQNLSSHLIIQKRHLGTLRQ